MTPTVAIALVYAIVAGGILIYLQRVRRRLRQVEADLHAQEPPDAAEPLKVQR